MRYLALRRRAEVLLAGLGRDGTQTLHIVGGLPPDTKVPVSPGPPPDAAAGTNPQADSGLARQPEAPHPPRTAGLPDPMEPSDTGNNGVYPNVDLGSKTE
jgi:hypothetical protein